MCLPCVPLPQTGATPLTVAAEKGNTDVVNLLIEHKATVNAQDKVYCMYSHTAVYMCQSIIMIYTIVFICVDSTERSLLTEIRTLLFMICV